ncbi:hypothetical protein TNCV_1968371 [Trichonephila clavipes]|nr:hypothetical protein TNCV_1968371 [Trichonephila clavipes]
MRTTTPLLQTMLICRFVYMHCISGVNKTASKEDEEDVEEQWDGDRIIRGRDESYQCDVVHQEIEVQNYMKEIKALDQGWRISGTCAIDGTPSIKTVGIVVQNNKVHYEVLRASKCE